MMLLLMLASVLLLSPPLQPAAVARQMHAVPLDVHKFKVLGEEYDPENPHQQAPTYYHTVDDGQQSFVRGIYLPPQSTVTLFLMLATSSWAITRSWGSPIASRALPFWARAS